MELKDIVKFQKQFDEEHGWDWDVEDDSGRLERLKYVAIAIAGEAGEFANIIKKALREKFPEGKLPDAEKLEMLKKELIDIFIYTLLASRALDVDLESEYFKKIEELRRRFKDFEKKGL